MTVVKVAFDWQRCVHESGLTELMTNHANSTGMPKMLGYRHCGVEALVDADNGGNLIVQPSIVEKWLLMRRRTSTNNHSLTAYRDCA